MGKRIGSVVTSILYVVFTGCYQVSQVSMEEFMSEHHPDEATFQTNDGRAYHTEATDYRVVEDSLAIRGVQIQPDGTRVPYLGSIPVDSISAVHVETMHEERTSALLGGIGLVALVIAVSGKSSRPLFGVTGN